MKNFLMLLALCALPACMGSSDNETAVSTLTAPPAAPPMVAPPIGPTPDIPDVPTNTSFAGLLNNVRTGDVTYDSRVGRAAQVHANDMLTQNYLNDIGLDGRDAGDRLTAAGYDWLNFGQNIAQGDYTLEGVLAVWEGDPDDRIDNRNTDFQHFGLAKAGTGANQRWVLVLAEPKP